MIDFCVLWERSRKEIFGSKICRTTRSLKKVFIAKSCLKGIKLCWSILFLLLDTWERGISLYDSQCKTPRQTKILRAVHVLHAWELSNQCIWYARKLLPVLKPFIELPQWKRRPIRWSLFAHLPCSMLWDSTTDLYLRIYLASWNTERILLVNTNSLT